MSDQFFPPPIMEPPRVISGSKNLNLDHQRTSICKPNSKIYPDRDLLKQIRLKYGIVTVDDPLSKDDTWTENIKLIEIENDDQPKLLKSKNSLNDNVVNGNSCQVKMHNVQNEIRNQLAKLPSTKERSLVVSDSRNLENIPITTVCHCCTKVCRSQLSPKTTTSSVESQSTIAVPELINFIQKQNEQLHSINEKINQILKFQQSQQQTKPLPPPTTTIECVENNPNTESSNSGTNYLDSSIEKVRENLLQNVQISQTKQYKTTKNKKNDEESEFFSNILSKANSILLRNGSYSSSNSSSTDTTAGSNGFRSSCSITPDTSDIKTAKNDPKKHARTIKNPRQLLRTEQSIYIQRLAAKYQINNDDDDNDCNDDSSHDDEEFFNQEFTSSLIMERVESNFITKKHQLNNRKKSNRYGLSDHNSSIATRNYLDKYGLTMDTNDDIQDKQKQTSQQQYRYFHSDPLMYKHHRHKTTAFSNDNDLINHKPCLVSSATKAQITENQMKNKLSKTTQTEVKSLYPRSQKSDQQNPSEHHKQLLDLNVIRRLPKLK